MSLVGGVLGFGLMLWLLFQTGRIEPAIAFTFALGSSLFALGIYAGAAALRQSGNWLLPNFVFWLLQVPLFASPVISYYSSAALGTWLYASSEPRIGWSFYLGSQLQLSVGQGPAEIVAGINVIAAILAVATGRAAWQSDA